ncbi:MAG: glucose-6-phosphate dehydrogenase [Gammaproteobacteria bacterium]
MSQIIPVQPFDYVVFGGTGDLSMRKLFPALFYREVDGQLPDDASVIAVARGDLDQAAFLAQLEAACRKYVDKAYFTDEVWQRFAKRFKYARVDALTPEGYAELLPLLDHTEARVRVFYLATSPRLFGAICEHLDGAGLVTRGTRVVLEKPIGHDLNSSCEINDQVGRYFHEDQIYRIDHYLGKETVQNLLALRFGNILFESVWSSAVIDHVQITAAETVGLGTRAAYYDSSGALRDMVQNHLLQLLCLVAMEAPYTMSADAVRDEKVKVLNSLRPMKDADVPNSVIFGQYEAGAIDSESVPSYATELERTSRTETFVALKANIDNWRWAGVPFYLRTGKRLNTRHSEIVISFREIPHSAFPGDAGAIANNRLVIRLQPDEGVGLRLMTKDPGPGGMRLRTAPLDLSFAEEFNVRYPDSYERLLLDVVRGDSTLFMRRDEVQAAWGWVGPIIDHWEASSAVPKGYPAGSWGPTSAATLIDRDGRSWHEDMH